MVNANIRTTRCEKNNVIFVMYVTVGTLANIVEVAMSLVVLSWIRLKVTLRICKVALS